MASFGTLSHSPEIFYDFFFLFLKLPSYINGNRRLTTFNSLLDDLQCLVNLIKRVCISLKEVFHSKTFIFLIFCKWLLLCVCSLHYKINNPNKPYTYLFAKFTYVIIQLSFNKYRLESVILRVRRHRIRK